MELRRAVVFAVGGLAACAGSPPPPASVELPRAPDAGATPPPADGVDTRDAASDAQPALAAAADARAAGLDCDRVSDADVLALGACVVADKEPPRDGDAVPPALKVTVTPRPAKLARGGHLVVVVSFVNAGSTPLPLAFVPQDFFISFLDARHASAQEPRGKCAVRQVLNLGEVRIEPFVRVVLTPGGSLHRTFEWDAVARRWGALASDGRTCAVVDDGPLPPGKYFAHVSLPGFGDYGQQQLPDAVGRDSQDAAFE